MFGTPVVVAGGFCPKSDDPPVDAAAGFGWKMEEDGAAEVDD
jgi:hypothetical protein